MMSEIRNYLSPHHLDDALKAMAEGDVTVVCGGTDLAPQTESGQREYAGTLMNIRRVAGLADISLADNELRIGTLATVTDIMNNPAIEEFAPVLVEAADQFASDQIRNAASLGGNICNASPAGDMIIPLLVLDAAVELANWQGGTMRSRRVALEDFFTAPGKTVKQDNELLTAVVFPQPGADFVAHFKKSGPRPALEISTVSVGIGGNLQNGLFSNVRVALGAVAPTPIRARHIESVLEGKPLDPERINLAMAQIAEDATPIDDIRGSAWYRDRLLRVFIEEVLNNALETGN